ncbi:hypothetical protein N7478_004106 [Penicillium angulare]|uniref:uncharacterized protein n=1 Tax=Penicillium angulare TaxID=116970 RepID=UPI0025403085|nr:uncharacterized protein N7478_004106 [Penicillium angulare]KAJ5278734.1 hypothetical protein N7478_004106 [Penicillium angulare]
MSILFFDSYPSTESEEENPDLFPMFKLEMEKAQRPVTRTEENGVHTYSTTKLSPRNPSRHDSPPNEDLKLLVDSIADYAVSFELSDFPAIVADWIPRLAQDPLPGSYQHLLLLIFAEGRYCVSMHRAMADAASIPDFLSTHRHRIRLFERTRNIDRQWTLREEPKKAPRLATHPDYTAEGCRIDEWFFESDLATLRELVGPLRDAEHPVLWITGRTKRAKEMLEQWEASMERIKQFKQELIVGQFNRKINWTIYDSAKPKTEEREDLMSMRQSRIDACKASTVWGEYLPDESQLWESNKYARGLHMKNFNRRSNSEKSVDLNYMPKPNVTKSMGYYLGSIIVPQTLEESLLNFIVQIAEWLALARGFPAVHLFIDMVRLFTSYGVDLANATQVQYCRFIPRMRPSACTDRPLRRRTKSLLNFQEKTGAGNQQYFADVKEHNQYLFYMLFQRNTLLFFDNESISWEGPLQTLEWVNRQGRKVLNSKGSCPRHQVGSSIVPDGAWQDIIKSDRPSDSGHEISTKKGYEGNDSQAHKEKIQKEIIDANGSAGRNSSAILRLDTLAAVLDTMESEGWKHRIRKRGTRSE